MFAQIYHAQITIQLIHEQMERKKKKTKKLKIPLSFVRMEINLNAQFAISYEIQSEESIQFKN